MKGVKQKEAPTSN